MARERELICAICGKPFVTTAGRVKYCSLGCAEEGERRVKAQRRGPYVPKKKGPSLADKYAEYKRRVLQQGGKPLSYGYFVAGYYAEKEKTHEEISC